MTPRTLPAGADGTGGPPLKVPRESGQPPLLRVGYEIERRVLAPRQERRIGKAYQAAKETAERELNAGRKVRSDGFFDQPDPETASPAEEILEGVLRTAADAWEERKVPYIGRIFATLSFEPSVSAADASYLLKLADGLTYQQIVLLAFWEAAQDPSGPLAQEVQSAVIRRSEGMSRPTDTIIAEMNDLAAAGLLGVIDSSGQLVPVGQIVGGLGGFGSSGGGIDLTSVQLSGMGATFHQLMGLDQVPDADLMQIARSLHGRS